MTTRLLDAGVRAQLQVLDDEDLVNGHQIIWGNVLRSLGADQSYRRTIRASVQSKQVARYIIEDPAFPRTINYCLTVMTASLARLPKNEPVLKVIHEVQKKIAKTVDYSDLGEPMKDLLNEIQLDIVSIHNSISQNWFTNQ